MAIDEIIKSFDYIKHVGNGESTYEHCREEIALNEAVAIMRKYQKIEEILDQLIDSKIRTYDAVTEIEDIVFGQAGAEDGNDD